METDWAGTYVFRAPVVRPADVDAVRTAVREATHVRALGTRHTFNGLAESPGVLLDLTALPDDVQVREDGTVWVTAGTTYGALARELHQHGRGLHNLGSLPHISVGGAVATGTHGSGDALGVLATAVREVELVDADGELRTVRRDDADGAGLLVALGSIGVVVRLRLETQPSYEVRQDVYRDLALAAVVEDPAAVTGAGTSVSVFTRWDGRADAWVKTRWPADVPDALLGAPRDPVSRDGITDEIRGNVTEQGGVPGPWHERLPHFRDDATPSSGEEIQSEFFVDRADAGAAIAAVAALGDRIREHLVVSELRTVAADGLWLSAAHGRDSLAVHFTWRRTAAARDEALPLVEDALREFGARPHWGKAHHLGAAELERVVPRLAEARDLFQTWDPRGVFSSPGLVGLGVRSS